MTQAMLSAVKTVGCVFPVGFSQQYIPLQRNSLTTIQLLFLRWNKGGLYCLSVREVEPPQANTPHGWRTIIVYTRIYKIAADMKPGLQGEGYYSTMFVWNQIFNDIVSVNVKIIKSN